MFALINSSIRRYLCGIAQLKLNEAIVLVRTLRPRTHGNVFLRFCIVYCSQGNREQLAHYLKQYENVSVCTGPKAKQLAQRDDKTIDILEHC